MELAAARRAANPGGVIPSDCRNHQKTSGRAHPGALFRRNGPPAALTEWLPMIDDGLGFSLVPWHPVLEQRLGRQVTGIAMPGGGIDWTFGRNRGLGF